MTGHTIHIGPNDFDAGFVVYVLPATPMGVLEKTFPDPKGARSYANAMQIVFDWPIIDRVRKFR